MQFRLMPQRMIIAMMLAVAACDDPLAPFQPEIASATDNFQLQATDVAGVTSTVTHEWNNTGTRATVNHSTTTNAGTATLTLRDAAGTIVYTKALAPSLNEPTAAGVAGAWKIELRMSGYRGSLNFRVQKL